jgi:hypothetical protein
LEWGAGFELQGRIYPFGIKIEPFEKASISTYTCKLIAKREAGREDLPVLYLNVDGD